MAVTASEEARWLVVRLNELCRWSQKIQVDAAEHSWALLQHASPEDLSALMLALGTFVTSANRLLDEGSVAASRMSLAVAEAREAELAAQAKQAPR